MMENQELLLSVIVTVFNVELYIHRCLESIINQTYMNLEIIVVDDGSEDASGKICDDFSKKDNRIKVLHRKNAGLVSARCLGIEQAKGDLITFVDADDWIEIDMYADMLANYNDEDMITSGLIYEWDDRRELLFDSFMEGVFDRNSIEDTILLQMMYNEAAGQQGITASLCNKLFKSSLLKKIIKLIDKKLTFGEDGATVYCFVTYSDKIKIMKKAWYHYFQHEDSMIKSNDLTSFEKIYRLRKCFLKNFSNQIPILSMESQIEYYLKPFLHAAIANIYRVNMNNVSYLFPYDIVPQNSKIILYGAGNIGYSFWKNIRYEDYVKLVAWVDKDYIFLQKKGFPVESLESALVKVYDYVIIAIENEKVVDEVRNKLLKHGLKQEKIIWKKVRKVE